MINQFTSRRRSASTSSYNPSKRNSLEKENTLDRQFNLQTHMEVNKQLGVFNNIAINEVGGANKRTKQSQNPYSSSDEDDENSRPSTLSRRRYSVAKKRVRMCNRLPLPSYCSYRYSLPPTPSAASTKFDNSVDNTILLYQSNSYTADGRRQEYYSNQWTNVDDKNDDEDNIALGKLIKREEGKTNNKNNPIRPSSILHIDSRYIDNSKDPKKHSFLQETFVDIDPHLIYSVLPKMDYNAVATVKYLLSLESKPTYETINQLIKPPEAIRCQNVYNGWCTNSNCPYDHDVDSTICWHWLNGHCERNDFCNFAHHWPKKAVQEIRKHRSYDPTKGIINSSFPNPILSGGSDSNDGENKKRRNSMAAIDNPHLYPTLEQTQPKRAARPLSTLCGEPDVKKYNEMVQKQQLQLQHIISSKKEVSRNRKIYRDIWNLFFKTPYKDRPFPQYPPDMPRFSSGPEVQQMYAKHRKPAIEQEQIYKNLLSEITNNSDLDDDWVDLADDEIYSKTSPKDKASTAYSKLLELHQQAAKKIFRERNPDHNPEINACITKRATATLAFDFHGLHANEVGHYLREILNACEKVGRPHVWIVTGAGHHSTDEQPVLIGAVEEFCRKHQIRFDNNVKKVENGGIVTVKGLFCILVKKV
ncbi:hypothetical protein H4219_004960 [Mycoemilia scoparia]|uniref:Uncharacterized protein n=1 Tax=Mycoemilia scoparia TaxID=417184 RepID=A0A9W7ZQU2_9FUNG|nr:hypothetical protein H4219_004960 [Mycoemilia scoparia]